MWVASQPKKKRRRLRVFIIIEFFSLMNRTCVFRIFLRIPSVHYMLRWSISFMFFFLQRRSSTWFYWPSLSLSPFCPYSPSIRVRNSWRHNLIVQDESWSLYSVKLYAEVCGWMEAGQVKKYSRLRVLQEMTHLYSLGPGNI